MRKIILLFIFLLVVCIAVILQTKSTPTITYFPIDEQSLFLTAHTKLEIEKDENNKKYAMLSVSSKSDEILYLRQDVTLLYADGKLKAVLSKWEENTDTIQINRTIPLQNYKVIQAISFHHGEKHNETIKSIHTMSHDEMNGYDKKLINNKLQAHWERLITHFDIPKEDYIVVPLTEIHTFNKQSIPNIEDDEMKKIIGQLWEGLYKNYIMPLTTNEKENQYDYYIPIILFHKKNTHLYVLFERNGENQMLIQKYSFPFAK